MHQGSQILFTKLTQEGMVALEFLDNGTNKDRNFRYISSHSSSHWAAKILPDLSWRRHGLGALQAYVTDDIRIHIWHHKLLTPGLRNSGSIHDHRFNMESSVLVGRISHREYLLGEPGSKEFDVYEVLKSETEWDASLRKLPYSLNASYGEMPINAGQTYRFPKREFHETLYWTGTITIVRKKEQEDSPPRILVPKGTEPINAIGAPANEVLLRNIVKNARLSLLGVNALVTAL